MKTSNMRNSLSLILREIACCTASGLTNLRTHRKPRQISATNTATTITVVELSDSLWSRCTAKGIASNTHLGMLIMMGQ